VCVCVCVGAGAGAGTGSKSKVEKDELGEPGVPVPMRDDEGGEGWGEGGKGGGDAVCQLLVLRGAR
jgi:hypothetical protein